MSVRLEDGYPTSWLMSFEEYDALPEHMDGEYIDGAFRLSPRPSRSHQEMARYLANVLAGLRRGAEEVAIDWSWKPGKDEYHPDVMMVPAAPDEVRFTGTPLLCIEITSSNRRDDLVEKRALYAQAGLGDYWVVDQREHELVRFRLEGGLLVEAGRARPAGIAHGRLDPPRTDGPGVIQARFADRAAIIDVDHLFTR